MDSKAKSLHITGLEPVRKMRLVDEASRVIRDAILTGKLTAGTRLRQANLAYQMGISRTPLREALMKLEQEGLITVLPRAGLQVVELKLEEAVELYEIREVLDGLAASLSAQRIDGQALKNLQDHLKKMDACVRRQNAHEWFTHHVAFHEGIFRVCGNARLQTLASTVVRLSIQHFHPLLLSTPNRLAQAYQQHEEIFRAIVTHDPKKSEELARQHISTAKEIVLRVMVEERRSAQAG